MLKILGYVWASPCTMLGIGAGVLGLMSGGSARCRYGVLEFYGGAVQWLLERCPNAPCAMTLGHVVLGRTAAALDMSFSHEQVHVQQYQRWGPIMIPAYLLCSLILWIRHKDPYRDNPFEREAFGRDAMR